MQPENTHQPARSRLGKLAAAGLIALAWLVLGAALGEGVARWREARALSLGQALEQQMQQQAIAQTAALCKELGLPEPGEGKDITARKAFAVATAADRAAYAASRGEAVFVADPAGRTVEAYPATGLPTAIAGAVEAISAKQDIRAPLGPQEAADAAAALSMALGGAQQFRDYPIEAAGQKDVAQFVFHPMGAQVGVFIRPSIWKELWVSFRPGAHQDDAYDIAINSHGFRDREVAVPKPAGLFRIVCVGGSTTAEGPRNELTYPKFLERFLRERYGADRIEVINGGVFASTSYTERDRLDQLLVMQPDLLLHFNLVNDLTNFMPVWVDQQRNARPASGTLQSIASHFAALRHGEDWLLPPEEELDRQMQQTIVQVLMEMAASAKERGVDTVFASFTAPDYANLPPEQQALFDRHITQMHWGRFLSMPRYVEVVERYNALLKRACEEQGHGYLPLAENFHHGADTYTDICHMYPAGNREKARALAVLLEPILMARGLSNL